jgi:hypothetical protein
MSTKAVRTNDPTSEASVARVDMKFEFVIPVSDRAKEFQGGPALHARMASAHQPVGKN